MPPEPMLRNGYLEEMRQARSRSTRLNDATEFFLFLPIVPLRKPRTEFAFQPVVFTRSFNVTPPGRFSSSRILAVLLPLVVEA